MSDHAPIHSYLDALDADVVKEAGFNYLVALLHKIGVSTAAKALTMNVPTLHRLIDPDRSIESITYTTAAYLVFMCETNINILRILGSNPRATAYYQRSNT